MRYFVEILDQGKPIPFREVGSGSIHGGGCFIAVGESSSRTQPVYLPRYSITHSGMYLLRIRSQSRVGPVYSNSIEIHIRKDPMPQCIIRPHQPTSAPNRNIPINKSHVQPSPSRPDRQPLNSGFVGAILLHIPSRRGRTHRPHLPPPLPQESLGRSASLHRRDPVPSMVSALPLPTKAPPVEKSRSSPPKGTTSPRPLSLPPKEKTAPPPNPADLLIKEKPITKPVKTTIKETPTPPKNPQTRPRHTQGLQRRRRHAASAIRLAAQKRHRHRHCSELRLRQPLRVLPANRWQHRYAELLHPGTRPTPSQDKSVTLLFDINRDGTPTNLHIETRSGSQSLDNAAMRAIQRIESFGPLPKAITSQLSTQV